MNKQTLAKEKRRGLFLRTDYKNLKK